MAAAATSGQTPSTRQASLPKSSGAMSSVSQLPPPPTKGPPLRQVMQRAISERAPKAYQQLLSSGELETTLDGLMAQYEESVDAAQGMAQDRLSRQDSKQYEPDPVKRSQLFASQKLVAQENALSQAIEQIDALSPTTDTSPES